MKNIRNAIRTKMLQIYNKMTIIIVMIVVAMRERKKNSVLPPPTVGWVYCERH